MKTFSVGQYKIRQRGNRYYVYELETINSYVKETYVGPLDK
ncbi:integrase, partial [Sulfolobus sp. A20-N-F8]